MQMDSAFLSRSAPVCTTTTSTLLEKLDLLNVRSARVSTVCGSVRLSHVVEYVLLVVKVSGLPSTTNSSTSWENVPIS